MKVANNKKIKLIIIILCVFLLSGCTKVLKDKDKKSVINKETGQSITENIICKPTNEKVIKIYEKNKVNISKLPSCKKFTPIGNYEGLWTSIFVKPLAFILLRLGEFVKNYGLSVIQNIACSYFLMS